MAYCHVVKLTYHCSGGSRIFPQGGCANSQKCYYFSNICRKLHENERIWTPKGAGAWVPGAPPPLDPPMHCLTFDNWYYLICLKVVCWKVTNGHPLSCQIIWMGTIHITSNDHSFVCPLTGTQFTLLFALLNMLFCSKISQQCLSQEWPFADCYAIERSQNVPFKLTNTQLARYSTEPESQLATRHWTVNIGSWAAWSCTVVGNPK